MKTRNLAVAFAFAGSLLVACGDGGSLSAPPLVPGVAGNTTVATTAANGATVIGAVSGKTYNFNAGVPAFGTTAPTTLAVTNSGAGFTASSGGKTAKGVLTYGSCIFQITESDYPAGDALALGKTITINPCNLNITTAGVAANGQPASRGTTLTLNNVTSDTVPSVISINSTGTLTIDGKTVSVLTLTQITGTN